MAKSSDFRTGRHVVFDIYAHLVFIPKYRKRVITKKIFETIKEAFVKVCRDFEAELREANYEADHVHLLVRYPPKVPLSALVNSLKGVSARRVRAAHLQEVQGKLFGKHFWSPSYCAVSCGGAPLEIIKQYINKQRQKSGSSPS